MHSKQTAHNPESRTIPLLSPAARQNTFVLKRRWAPGLAKANQKPHKLRAKHYVYDLIEDTTVQKRPNMEVVLTAFVDGFGDKGDVVSVKQHLAYNKLLLPGLAVYKTDANLLRYTKTGNETEEIAHSSPFAQRTVNVLESRVLAITMNKDNPWVLQPWHVRASLRKIGVNAVDEAIELPDTPITGPDLLKQNKEFVVVVRVNGLEKANVRCRIHHWSSDASERLPHVHEHWKEVAEPLFAPSSSAAEAVSVDK